MIRMASSFSEKTENSNLTKFSKKICLVITQNFLFYQLIAMFSKSTNIKLMNLWFMCYSWKFGITFFFKKMGLHIANL